MKRRYEEINGIKTLSSAESAQVAASEYFTSAGGETVTAAGGQPLDDTWTLGRIRRDLKRLLSPKSDLKYLKCL